MLVIGLTGSIGMGKSTAAARMRARGIPVFDSDAEVHRLYSGKAAPLIEAQFPGTTEKGVVDRAKLADALLEDPERFAQLEAIVHPLVREGQRDFLRTQAAVRAEMAVLEIPLLFETGADELVDVIIVVSASKDVQRERVLDRPGMSEAKLESILARQMPDSHKRAHADFVVDTNGPIAESEAQVDAIIAMLATREGEAFERCWVRA